MVTLELISESPEETERIGAQLAERLSLRDVVAVLGELGTGKTTLIRGACRALGVEKSVTSPTFTIGNRYEGRVAVSHLDLYRFETLTAADWAALEPYFDDTIVFVEWFEAGKAWLPSPRVVVRLAHVDPSRRAISLESDDSLALAGLI